MAKLDFPDRDQSPWTNPDNGITYVWKGGTQGAWYIASAGDTDIFVAKVGDTMTGELKLSAAGSVDITKDALSVYHGGNYNAFIDWGGNAAFYDLIGEDAHFTRSVEVGPTGDVKIVLNADGSAEFAGPVKAQYFRGIYDPVNISSNPEDYTCVRADDENGNVVAALYADGHAMFEGRLQVNQTSTIYLGDARITAQDYGLCFTSDGSAVEFGVKYDGSAKFANDVEMQSVYSRGLLTCIHSNNPALLIQTSAVSSTAQPHLIEVKASPSGLTQENIFTVDYPGNIFCRGSVNAQNIAFNLEPDNEANYTTTTEEYTETESYTGPLGNTLEREVTKTRDIRTYTGPTLDVKERLQNLIARLDSLEADEVTDDATSTLLLTTVNNLNADMTKTKAALTAIRTAANAAGTLEQLKADIATATADI